QQASASRFAGVRHEVVSRGGVAGRFPARELSFRRCKVSGVTDRHQRGTRNGHQRGTRAPVGGVLVGHVQELCTCACWWNGQPEAPLTATTSQRSNRRRRILPN